MEAGFFEAWSRCADCGFTGSRREVLNHQEEPCKRRPRRCAYGCGRFVRRTEIDATGERTDRLEAAGESPFFVCGDDCPARMVA